MTQDALSCSPLSDLPRQGLTIIWRGEAAVIQGTAPMAVPRASRGSQCRRGSLNPAHPSSRLGLTWEQLPRSNSPSRDRPVQPQPYAPVHSC